MSGEPAAGPGRPGAAPGGPRAAAVPPPGGHARPAAKAAQRAAEHPDGKWSLDSLRLALAELKPGIYGRMDNAQVAAVLRKEGIPVVTIRIGGKTHKGIRKADVDRLFAAREARRKGVTRP